jgi:hypothetical protein
MIRTGTVGRDSEGGAEGGGEQALRAISRRSVGLKRKVLGDFTSGLRLRIMELWEAEGFTECGDGDLMIGLGFCAADAG